MSPDGFMPPPEEGSVPPPAITVQPPVGAGVPVQVVTGVGTAPNGSKFMAFNVFTITGQTYFELPLDKADALADSVKRLCGLGNTGLFLPPSALSGG